MSTGGTFGAFKPPKPKSGLKLYALLGVLGILIIAAIYYLVFYGGVGIGMAVVLPPAQELNATELKVSRMSRLNFNIADTDFYKSLKLHGAIPINIEALGRLNPFSPF